MDGDSLRPVTLEDKYTLPEGRVYISGVQALVRLPIMQRERDQAQGLKTGGFISGYRGSPLGGYDAALWQAAKYLEANDIVFKPGLNEDLAATAVWGTQQLDFLPGRKVDGVFAIWYGKGPGVDRSGDPLKHANYQGSHPNGGVLVVVGDDHPGKSSTLAHQSEQALASFGIPVLYPSSVQDYLDFGLYGFALSRFAGTLVGFKCVNETVTSTATVTLRRHDFPIALPDDAPMSPDGIHARPEYDPPGQDVRLTRYKLPRAKAFARANRLDKAVFGAETPRRLGIVTAGKAYLDVVAALRLLGIDDAAAREMGLGVYKVAMVWPLEDEGLMEFAGECDELLFVEEKRPVMEDQARVALYGGPISPRITGKAAPDGSVLLPEDVQLEAVTVAEAIAKRLEDSGAADSSVAERIAGLRAMVARPVPDVAGSIVRSPYFCSGCPHNTSTKVPDGSFAMAGIGCHGMALLMDRSTLPVTHMGGEGAPWAGIAPFTDTPHIFQNLGDGTYVHSGSLAIRAAVQSGTNITYKILVNDATAMTGGQPVDGNPTVGQILKQVLAEGARKVAIVSDAPEQFGGLVDMQSGVSVHHRDDLDAVQKDLRTVPGTSVLIYEQTCGAEKRRRRKRKQFPDPPKRMMINSDVCEGCGDCSAQANCVSIHPLETPLGRKRTIDQSSCNKDYSCVKGFCPSFVSVHGGRLRRPDPVGLSDDLFDALPAPVSPKVEADWNVLITGIGGTGVVTIGAVLGMAAHLEGKSASVFDMTGLSQKNGAVFSHLKISDDGEGTQGAGIGLGQADLILGCDIISTASPGALRTAEPGRTMAVVNTTVVPTPAFQETPDLKIDGGLMERGITAHVGDQQVHALDATRIALALTGDTIGANTFMIGYALQLGGLPLSVAAIERAIELNGVAVPFNLRALRLGRLAAADPDRIAALMPAPAVTETVADDLDAIVAHRRDLLTAYQDAAYADRYEAMVAAAREAEARLGGGRDAFSKAVARYGYKLMAYKDEYEVARLYAEGGFDRRVQDTFEGDYQLKVHLAPPLLARRDPETGHLVKREFGPWVFSLFRVVARMKGLRGTFWDPFGHTAERKAERRLRDQYAADIARLAESLSAETYDTAVNLAEIPEQIRGFGHVKEAAMASAEAERERLLAALERPEARSRAA